MIHFDCVTLFPQMFAALTESGITGRALKAARYDLELWIGGDFPSDNYRTVDDRPYGGGPSMVMLAPAAGGGFGRRKLGSRALGAR